MKPLLLAFFMMLRFSLFAQNPIQLEVQSGLVIGSPFSKIPDNVVDFGGAPSIAPTFRAIVHYHFSESLSAAFGLGYAKKGNNFNTTIEDKYDVARGIFGENFPLPFNVNYTASSDGSFDNQYLDIPIYLTFRRNKFHFICGYQYSRLLRAGFDGVVDVRVLFVDLSPMNFDESEQIRPNDHAVLAGMSFELRPKLTFTGQFTYAINYIFKEAPEGVPNMRNLYGALLIGYRF